MTASLVKMTPDVERRIGNEIQSPHAATKFDGERQELSRSGRDLACGARVVQRSFEQPRCFRTRLMRLTRPHDEADDIRGDGVQESERLGDSLFVDKSASLSHGEANAFRRPRGPDQLTRPRIRRFESTAESRDEVTPNVLALDVAELAQAVASGNDARATQSGGGRRVQDSDGRDLAYRLCASDVRPDQKTASYHSDKCAPIHQ